MATYTDNQCGLIFVASSAAMFAGQRLPPAAISDRFERNLARICTQCDKRKRGFSGHVQMPYYDL